MGSNHELEGLVEKGVFGEEAIVGRFDKASLQLWRMVIIDPIGFDP